MSTRIFQPNSQQALLWDHKYVKVAYREATHSEMRHTFTTYRKLTQEQEHDLLHTIATATAGKPVGVINEIATPRTRLYMDIDHLTPDVHIDSILVALQRAVRHLAGPQQCAVDTRGSHSFHVVWPTFFVRREQLKAVMEQLVAVLLRAENHLPWKTFVDTNATARGWLSMLHSDKYDSENRFVIPNHRRRWYGLFDDNACRLAPEPDALRQMQLMSIRETTSDWHWKPVALNGDPIAVPPPKKQLVHIEWDSLDNEVHAMLLRIPELREAEGPLETRVSDKSDQSAVFISYRGICPHECRRHASNRQTMIVRTAERTYRIICMDPMCPRTWTAAIAVPESPAPAATIRPRVELVDPVDGLVPLHTTMQRLYPHQCGSGMDPLEILHGGERTAYHYASLLTVSKTPPYADIYVSGWIRHNPLLLAYRWYMRDKVGLSSCTSVRVVDFALIDEYKGAEETFAVDDLRRLDPRAADAPYTVVVSAHPPIVDLKLCAKYSGSIIIWGGIPTANLVPGKRVHFLALEPPTKARLPLCLAAPRWELPIQTWARVCPAATYYLGLFSPPPEWKAPELYHEVCRRVYTVPADKIEHARERLLAMLYDGDNPRRPDVRTELSHGCLNLEHEDQAAEVLAARALVAGGTRPGIEQLYASWWEFRTRECCPVSENLLPREVYYHVLRRMECCFSSE